MITDAHEISSWCKKSCELIVPISLKKSNHKGFRYFTSVLGNGEFWLTHAFHIDDPRDSQYHVSKAHVVSNSFSKAHSKAHQLVFDVNYAHLDSRFFEVETLRELMRRKISYLVIARKTDHVCETVLKGHYMLDHNYEPMTVPAELKSKKYGTVQYNLVIVPRSPEKRVTSPRNTHREIVGNYVTPATNMNHSSKIGTVNEVISKGTAGLKGIIKRWAIQLAELDYANDQTLKPIMAYKN